MRRATMPLFPEERPPYGDARHGRDEMNFAEFPLVVLSDRPPKGVKTIQYQDVYEDPRTGKVLPRKVIITGSDEYGLPTAKDDEVLVGLLYVTKARNNFSDPTVHFSRREFLRVLNWPEEGKYYHRLHDSLYRWLGVTVRYEDCWWDNEKKRYGTEAFHLLDNVSLYDERTKNRATSAGQLFLPLSSFKWNSIPFKNFQHDYMKGLDLDLFLQLPGAASKRAYRYLDKHLPADGTLLCDMRLFACEKIGLSRNYKPARLLEEVQETVVRPLERAGFIAPMDAARRFVKQARGSYGIVFMRGETPPVESPPAEPAGETAGRASVVRSLVDRGVSRKVAEQLAAERAAEYLQVKIDVFDWMVEVQHKYVTGDNPAGFLVKAIRDDYAPPKGYEPKEERERRKQAADKRHRKAEDKRRQEQVEAAALRARREHVQRHLQGLTPQQVQQLEADALAHADAEKRTQATGGPFAKTYLRFLVEDEVLRVCPLPEPQA